MSGTVTGLDLDAIEAQREAWAQAARDGDMERAEDYAYRLAAAVPSLLAAARAVQAVRLAVHLDDDDPINTRDAEPRDDDWQRAAYEDGWDAAVDHMRGLVRAALGTE